MLPKRTLNEEISKPESLLYLLVKTLDPPVGTGAINPQWQSHRLKSQHPLWHLWQ